MSHKTLAGASLIAMLAGLQPACAQTTPAPAAQPAASQETPVADIIVTAQRREEKLSNVPLAVTALGQADLSRNNVTDMSRLTFATPGLSFGKQGSDFFPAIRGVRTLLVSAASDPVIGFYIDGIYQSRVAQQSFPMFDVARVEVQRGPQGILFGRNTFGGNIAVVNQEPGKELSAGVNGQIGNFALRQVDGFVNVPLGDTAGLRIAAYHSQRDGYLVSTVNPGIRLNDDDQTAVRGSFRIEPISGLKILVTGAYWKRNAQGGGAFAGRVNGTLINLAMGLRSINGSPVAVNPTVMDGSVKINGISEGVAVSPGLWTNSWDYTPFEHLEEYYGTAQVSYDLGPVTLKSITGLNDFSVDRSADLDQTSVIFPAPGVTAGFAGSGYQAQQTLDKAFSQELQVATNGHGRLQGIFGLYYFNDRVLEYYRQVYTAPSAVTANALSTRSRTQLQTKAYAAYGQGTFAIVPDRLRLTAGVRYSQDDKTFNITNQTASPGTENFDTQTPATASGNPSFGKVTWRAGLDYTPRVGRLFYGSVSTGYESGGFNNNASNKLIPGSYAPQEVTAYEIGTKNRFGGRVSLDLSAFYNDYRDLQITVLDQLTNLSYTQSAGKARSYGIEGEMRIVPVDHLHIDLTGTWLNAKFTQYLRPNPFHVAGGDDGVTVSLAGKSVPLSPSFKGTASVYYDLPVGRSTLTPRVNWLYSTSYYVTDFNTALDRQAAYSLFDASLRFTAPNQRFYIEGFVDNIGDKAILYAGTIGSNGRVQINVGPPRFYGLRAGTRF